MAREWAEINYPELVEVAEGTLAADLLKKAKAAAEYILAHTTPETMADVEWDDEKHYLAGADDVCGDSYVMLSNAPLDEIWAIDLEQKDIVCLCDEHFIPNGKRYELREIVKPGHPEVLKTVKDYANAPEGTLAASSHGEGYFHNETMSRWESTHGDWKNYVEMESSSHSGRTVLRWGWGGEA